MTSKACFLSPAYVPKEDMDSHLGCTARKKGQPTEIRRKETPVSNCTIFLQPPTTNASELGDQVNQRSPRSLLAGSHPSQHQQRLGSSSFPRPVSRSTIRRNKFQFIIRRAESHFGKLSRCMHVYPGPSAWGLGARRRGES